MSDTTNILTDFFSFLKASPTPYHTVATIACRLKEAGFVELSEADAWEIVPGGRYFTTRNASSIIAFSVGDALSSYSFNITATHSDSPTFKLKENAIVSVKDRYTVLNTEGYGGMLCSTWMDRPLSIAGRVMVRCDNRVETRLIDFARDLVLIPSLAIHLNRTANEGQTFNKQTDMRPLLGGSALEPAALKALLSEELSVPEECILGSDLFLYNREAPAVWGIKEEFLSGPRLDDLQCVYGSLMGFLEGNSPKSVNVFACFDNEEVGSGTKQGAASTFLPDVLQRMNAALGKSGEDLCRALAGSLLISCDNGQALHPNHPDKTDVTNSVYPNGGIVIKSHAGQKYTSDAVSVALFTLLCQKAGVPIQHYANRSDMAGGSTLGNIAMGQVSVNAIDIGLAQLAMHSAYETSGAKDLAYLIRACAAFYQSHIRALGDGAYEIDENA